jgi:phosphatidylinositol kinase/protein kinase (PI-3  family)
VSSSTAFHWVICCPWLLLIHWTNSVSDSANYCCDHLWDPLPPALRSLIVIPMTFSSASQGHPLNLSLTNNCTSRISVPNIPFFNSMPLLFTALPPPIILWSPSRPLRTYHHPPLL